MMTSKKNTIVAKIKGKEPRIDSRLIAGGLGIAHNNFIALAEKYKSRLSAFGLVLFETDKVKAKMGRPERIVYLNENQCYAIVTLSKNTERAVDLKFALVMAFSEAREALAAVTDYLPSYREAHDNLAQLVRLNGSSVPESVHHTNLEKMINKALRVPTGSRKQLPPATRSAIAVAERIASVACEQALHTGQDHKAAYQKAKTGVLNYAKTVVPILPIIDNELVGVADGTIKA
jgi:phage regulator Rha-like protein